jgi:hypothetical protein
MDQQPIVLYLAKKGLAAVGIYEDLVATLGGGGDELSFGNALPLRSEIRDFESRDHLF